MKWIFIFLGFLLLLGIALWYVNDMTKLYKEEQENFEKGNYVSENVRIENKQYSKIKKDTTEVNKMFKEKLDAGLTPLEITKFFIVDYYKWNEYAFKQSQTFTEEKDLNIKTSYTNLIIKYCGKNKNYQGLTYGSDGEALENFVFLEENFSQNNAIVKVKFQDPEFDFQSSTYEYHFKKLKNKYILEEKYYVDDDGEKHPYL